MTKPEFTVKILDSGITPSSVEFLDLIGNVTLWDYGDGILARPDSQKTRTIVHVYKKAGTFQVKATDENTHEQSVPVPVIIKESVTPPPPQPEPSLLDRFIAWLRKLFGLA